MSEMQERECAEWHDYAEELNLIVSSFSKDSILTFDPNKITLSNVDFRMDTVVDTIIEEKVDIKPLPLSLRKRLMCIQALSA